MAEDPKRKELRRLLGTISSRDDLERKAEREREIQRHRVLYRFEEAKRAVLMPALRDAIADLEGKGHLTRLREKSAHNLRLDVQLRTATRRWGSLDLKLLPQDPPTVRIHLAWGHQDPDEREIPLDKLDRPAITDAILRLLKGLM